MFLKNLENIKKMDLQSQWSINYCFNIILHQNISPTFFVAFGKFG